MYKTRVAHRSLLGKCSRVKNFVLGQREPLPTSDWTRFGHTFTLQPLCPPQAQRSSWGQSGDFTKREMASTLALLVLLQLALFSSVTCKKGELLY